MEIFIFCGVFDRSVKISIIRRMGNTTVDISKVLVKAVNNFICLVVLN